MKKPWSKPRLVVLVRGKPEEAILISCKAANATTGDPMQWQVACIQDGDFCDVCSMIASS
jgi:hypothetical protein